MKYFEKPSCEIVRFGIEVISTSACNCWDGEDSWPDNCQGDVGQCTCKVNYDPAQDNCIIPGN